jgi:hypothetical protein
LLQVNEARFRKSGRLVLPTVSNPILLVPSRTKKWTFEALEGAMAGFRKRRFVGRGGVTSKVIFVHIQVHEDQCGKSATMIPFLAQHFSVLRRLGRVHRRRGHDFDEDLDSETSWFPPPQMPPGGPPGPPGPPAPPRGGPRGPPWPPNYPPQPWPAASFHSFMTPLDNPEEQTLFHIGDDDHPCFRNRIPEAKANTRPKSKAKAKAKSLVKGTGKGKGIAAKSKSKSNAVKSKGKGKAKKNKIHMDESPMDGGDGDGEDDDVDGDGGVSSGGVGSFAT